MAVTAFHLFPFTDGGNIELLRLFVCLVSDAIDESRRLGTDCSTAIGQLRNSILFLIRRDIGLIETDHVQ